MALGRPPLSANNLSALTAVKMGPPDTHIEIAGALQKVGASVGTGEFDDFGHKEDGVRMTPNGKRLSDAAPKLGIRTGARGVG